MCQSKVPAHSGTSPASRILIITIAITITTTTIIMITTTVANSGTHTYFTMMYYMTSIHQYTQYISVYDLPEKSQDILKI